MTTQINPNALAKAALLLLLLLPVVTAAFWPFSKQEDDDQERRGGASRIVKVAKKKVKDTGSFVQDAVASAATHVGEIATEVQKEAKERSDAIADIIRSKTTTTTTTTAEDVKEANLKAMDAALKSALEEESSANVVEKATDDEQGETFEDDKEDNKATGPYVAVKQVPSQNKKEAKEDNTKDKTIDAAKEDLLSNVAKKTNGITTALEEKAIDAMDGLKGVASNAGQAVKYAFGNTESIVEDLNRTSDRVASAEDIAKEKAREAQRMAGKAQELADQITNSAEKLFEARGTDAEDAVAEAATTK